MRIVQVLILGFALLACADNDQTVRVFLYTFDFSSSNHGWTGDFADYPEGDSVFYELEFKHTTLPPPLSQTRKGLKLRGNNHSDDLFMFIKGKITGLTPNTPYHILFNVKFASNVPTGAVGIGGAPGEGVTVKAGATPVEPKKVVASGFYLMNINKGNQSQAGVDMQVIGHVGVAATTTQYTEVFRNNSSLDKFTVTSNAAGELWIIIGTDSGFEGTTTLYYTAVDVMLSQAD